MVVAYAQNLVNYRDYRWELALDPKRADGPADTVKVILRTGVPGSETRYWIDTKRSHMLVRQEHVSVTSDATNNVPAEVTDYSRDIETADRSPQGIWYPTLIRNTSVIEEKGEKKTIETIIRHYLDFDVRFTDDLFQPVDRPGEHLGKQINKSGRDSLVGRPERFERSV